MRKQALAVLFTILLATAGAAAYTGVQEVTVDSHTTDSDFNNATTLDNVSIEGSGTSANLLAARSSYTTTPIDQAAVGDGYSETYQADDVDAALNPTIDLTGQLSTEYNTVSASGVSLNHTTSLPIGGNLDPTDGAGGNPIIEITGHSNGWEISEASYTGNSLDVSTEDQNARTVYLTPDGKTMIYGGGSVGEVHEYTLTTAWDLSTASYSNTVDFSSETDSVQGLSFADNGSVMVLTGSSDMYQYQLSTDYDISTASYNSESLDVSSKDSYEQGTAFSADGTKFYFVGQNTNSVYEYSLSTAYDITTATYEQSLDFSSLGDNGGDLEFNDDGTKMYVVAMYGDSVIEYGLSTPYDISTASHVQTTDLSSQDSQSNGIHIGNAGSKMYMTGGETNTVYEYDTSTNPDNIEVSDDTGASVTFGKFNDGETKTDNIDLKATTSIVTINGSGGSVDYDISIQERTQTQDPGVDFNGNWLNHSGTLSEGEQVTLEGSSTWVQSSNDVTVNLPSLSSDAPLMEVGLEVQQDYQTVASPATYISDAFSVSDTTAGTVDIAEIDNGSAEITWQLYDGSGWYDIKSDTVTSAGVHKLDWSAGAHTMARVRIDFADDGTGEPLMRVASDSIQFDNTAPSISNTAPTGDVRYSSNTITADISDPDYSTQQGDTVTVDLTLDGSVVESQEFTSNGTFTYDTSAFAEGTTHNWDVSIEDNFGGTDSESGTFTVNHYEPEVDNSSLSPDRGLSQPDVNLNVDVSDGDFPLDGDTVTAEYFVKDPSDSSFNSVGIDTTTSNATLSVPYTASLGGDYEWYAVVTDSYGHSVTTQTAAFQSPSILEVRNETSGALLDGISLELQFYSQETEDTATIETRTTTDGTINLTGLPVDDPIVAISSADTYYDRRITIRSVYDQQTIYLLNESYETARPTFVVNDYTGQFPSTNTVVEVQRSINDSYKTVYGDFLGTSDELPTQLRYNTRHRIRLYNPKTGASRIVGTTMATATVEKQIDVFARDDPEIRDGDRSVVVGPDTEQLAAAANTDISVQYSGDDTDDWSVKITYSNDTVTNTLAERYYTGSQSDTFSLNLSQYNGGEIQVNATHPGGWNRPIYQVERTYQTDGLLNILPTLTTNLGGESGGITSLLAVMVTLFGTAGVAATIGASANAIGLTALTGLAAFSVIGWIPYGIVFAAAVGWGTIVALREGL